MRSSRPALQCITFFARVLDASPRGETFHRFFKTPRLPPRRSQFRNGTFAGLPRSPVPAGPPMPALGCPRSALAAAVIPEGANVKATEIAFIWPRHPPSRRKRPRSPPLGANRVRSERDRRALVPVASPGPGVARPCNNFLQEDAKSGTSDRATAGSPKFSLPACAPPQDVCAALAHHGAGSHKMRVIPPPHRRDDGPRAP